MNKSYVVIKFNDGRVKVWCDYHNVAWGSPIYTVLDYFDSYKAAQAFARLAR